MEDSKLTLYVVERLDDRLMFVPSPMFSNVMVGAFGVGSAFFIYLSTIFFRSGDFWFGVIFILVASFSAGFAIRAWYPRRTPLSVESSGRVSYGDRELCATGTVQGVRIVPTGGGDCDVCIALADGKLVSIPSQYFTGFNSREHARPFAAELAKALGVQVTEQLPSR